MFEASWYVSLFTNEQPRFLTVYWLTLLCLAHLQAEYMPVSEQNRNMSTSMAIPDTDHEFSAPDSPDDDDDDEVEMNGKTFTIS